MRFWLAASLLLACSRPSSGGNAAAKPEPPPISVEASDLEDAYFQRQMLADHDFGDRTLAVTGVVTESDEDYGRRWHVWLGATSYFEAGRGRDQTMPDPGIDCPIGPESPTDPALAAKARTLRPGSRVTLMCKNGSGHHRETLGVDVWSPTLYDCRF